MITKNNQKLNGFTLVEVLLASFIFVVTVGAITVLFITSSNVQTQSKAIRDVDQSGRYALEAIARDIKASYSNYWNTTNKEVNDDSSLIGKLSVPAFFTNGSSTLIIRTSEDKGLGCVKYELADGFIKLTKGIFSVRTSDVTSSLSVNNDCTGGSEESDIKVTDPDQVKITKLDFSGSYTPIDANNDINKKQPFVKISITVESPQYETTTKAVEKAIQTLETTVVSSSYPLGSSQ